MGILKALISAKAVEKAVHYLDSKNRMRATDYIPARKPAVTARSAALATAATSLVRRNPKLLATVGAGAAAVYLASYLVKRKQQQRTMY
jgi:hypothetical protein